MNAKEAKMIRVILRVIRRYAEDHDIEPVLKMATEGLRAVKNMTPKKVRMG